MKRMLLLAVLIALPLVTGCKKQLYHMTGTLNIAESFAVNDADGNYQNIGTINPADVNAELDIPDNAVIRSVEIETVYLTVHLQPSNQADNIQASASVRVLGGTYVPAFTNISVPLVEGTHDITALSVQAVAILKSQLQAVLMHVGTPGPIDVNLQLTANRAPVIADIDLVVRGTVNYDTCVDLPTWFSEGEDCNITE
jgi:hypothetical protein